jgi:hypothetical protein
MAAIDASEFLANRDRHQIAIAQVMNQKKSNEGSMRFDPLI